MTNGFISASISEVNYQRYKVSLQHIIQITSTTWIMLIETNWGRLIIYSGGEGDLFCGSEEVFGSFNDGGIRFRNGSKLMRKTDIFAIVKYYQVPIE